MSSQAHPTHFVKRILLSLAEIMPFHSHLSSLAGDCLPWCQSLPWKVHWTPHPLAGPDLLFQQARRQALSCNCPSGTSGFHQFFVLCAHQEPASYHCGKQAFNAGGSRTSWQFRHTTHSLGKWHSLVCHTAAEEMGREDKNFNFNINFIYSFVIVVNKLIFLQQLTYFFPEGYPFSLPFEDQKWLHPWFTISK